MPHKHEMRLIWGIQNETHSSQVFRASLPGTHQPTNPERVEIKGKAGQLSVLLAQDATDFLDQMQGHSDIRVLVAEVSQDPRWLITQPVSSKIKRITRDYANPRTRWSPGRFLVEMEHGGTAYVSADDTAREFWEITRALGCAEERGKLIDFLSGGPPDFPASHQKRADALGLPFQGA